MAGQLNAEPAAGHALADALRSIESVGQQILLLSRSVDLIEKINEESGDGCPPNIGEKMRALAAACLGVDPLMLRPPPIDLDSRPTRGA